MERERTKYPRTYHLPWSLGATNDDKIIPSTDMFLGKQVVVTEKMDGENFSVYFDGYTHARSIDSKRHESRGHMKQLAQMLSADIPEGYRICGENMWAKHSIHYHSLERYFLVFSIWDECGNCLGWDDTADMCELLGLVTVPVLYVGEWDEQKIKKLWTPVKDNGDEMEGYVVRVADKFAFEQFGESIAKFVREGHVQTEEHWMYQTVVKNELRQG